MYRWMKHYVECEWFLSETEALKFVSHTDREEKDLIELIAKTRR